MKAWEKVIEFRRRADAAWKNAQNDKKTDEYRRAWATVAREWELEAARQEKLAEEE